MPGGVTVAVFVIEDAAKVRGDLRGHRVRHRAAGVDVDRVADRARA